MPLAGYNTLRSGRFPEFASKENGKEHRAINIKGKLVNQYHIDTEENRGEEKRCDFLLMVEEEGRTAYLIELKGANIERAVEQLEATESFFKESLKGYEKKYRIVCSKCKTQKLYGNKIKAFKKKHRGEDEFVTKVDRLVEDI